MYATVTSICRRMLVLLPVAYPIAEGVSGAATMFFFTRIYRQKSKPLFNT